MSAIRRNVNPPRPTAATIETLSRRPPAIVAFFKNYFAPLLIFLIALPGALRAQNQPVVGTADSLHSRGENFMKNSQYDSAQALFQAEVKLREQQSDSIGIVTALNSLADAFCGARKTGDGLQTAKRALAIVRATVGENSIIGAQTFARIGHAYRFLFDYENALENYKKSLAIRLKILGPRHPDVAVSYRSIGGVYNELGDYPKALDYAQKALAIMLAFGPDDPDVAASYNNLGTVYENAGDYKKALENFTTALAIKLKLFDGNHSELASSYNNLGNVYLELGDYSRALDNQKKGLAIKLKTLGPDDPDVAGSYNNIGIIDRARGNYESALENHRTALSIRLKTLGPEHPDVAMSYSNLGNVYDDLGDYHQALENDTAALAIRLKIFGRDHPDVAASYNNIGNVYEELGDHTKALENYSASLAIKLKTLGAGHPDVATTYGNIGYVYGRLGDYPKALANHNQALAIRLAAFGPDHPDVAESYSRIGDVHQSQGNYTQALENYTKALTIRLAALGPEHPAVAESYFDLGKTYRAQHKPEQALQFLKQAIVIIEKVRSGVTSEELKQTYTEDNRERYEEIITLLLAMNRPREAFEYYQRSRSKLLQDELQKQGVEIGQGALRKKLDQVKALGQQVTTIEKQVIDEKSKPAGDQNKTRIENLTRLLAQTKGEFYQLVSEIKQNPDYAFTVTVDPIQFASIQQDLPEGNKLVMYYSSKDKLYILVVSKKGFRATSVEVAKDSLDRLVKSFRKILANTETEKPPSSPDPLLKTVVLTLYRYLISPIQDEVASATTLTFIPSGNLFYIPLGALAYEQDGKLRYLIEDKPISYLTSAELFRSVERKAKQPASQYDLLVVGDPAGADLPSAAEEATAIHALYPASKLYLDADAKKQQIEEQAPNYQILHLATHAFTNPQNPWDSYVYLVKSGEDNGHWTMAEVTNQTWDKMALVTLSACETAIGGDRPGLEMESLARAFSIAGAPSIIATLWPVSERSTKDLMVCFYTNLKTMSKVEALRQAQLSLINHSDYSQPFYWAPFILIGDGR